MNTVILLILKVAVSLSFFAAGIAKLAKAKPLVEQFHDFRLPPEIMYFIGVVEILGAIAIWFDALTVWALSGLACLMLGALKRHAVARHPPRSLLPAALLFVLCFSAILLVNWLG
ncbi:MAG: DoxX family protein [Pontiella sp.]